MARLSLAILLLVLSVNGEGLPPAYQKLVRQTSKTFWKQCQADIPHETVVGVMVTGKDAAHQWLATKAVTNFFNQSYPSKALVVINDSPFYRLTRSFPDNPCLIEVNATTYNSTGHLERWPLGTLRNLGLAITPANAVWLQWDDDDFRAPTYVSELYAELIRSKKPYIVIRRQLRVFLASNSSYVYESRVVPFVIGTIMARKTHRAAAVSYPALGKAEDTKFLKDLKKVVGQGAIWNNPPDVYFRLFHGANTWDAAHFGTHDVLPNEWCQLVKARLTNRISKYMCSPDGWNLHQAVMAEYSPFLALNF
eukprot:m.251272 g.251272  ORF g.251272 m.251272 type:complete len:308 (+) comp17521_c0_seq5:1891-2814(+)